MVHVCLQLSGAWRRGPDKARVGNTTFADDHAGKIIGLVTNNEIVRAERWPWEDWGFRDQVALG